MSSLDESDIEALKEIVRKNSIVDILEVLSALVRD